jgi:hypothetical protein
MVKPEPPQHLRLMADGPFASVESDMGPASPWTSPRRSPGGGSAVRATEAKVANDPRHAPQGHRHPPRIARELWRRSWDYHAHHWRSRGRWGRGVQGQDQDRH